MSSRRSVGIIGMIGIGERVWKMHGLQWWNEYSSYTLHRCIRYPSPSYIGGRRHLLNRKGKKATKTMHSVSPRGSW